ncbi:MAG: AraC family transcriptional regulator [Fimbriimonas sp.]
MKSLDSLLHSLRLRSAIQNRIVLGEPWGVEFPPMAKAGVFHFVEEGVSLLTVGDHPAVRLEKGDLAVVLSGLGHIVQDRLATPPIHLFDLVEGADVLCPSGLTLSFGGDGPQTSVISGDFVFDEVDTHPLWRMLPPFVVIKGQNGRAFEGLDTTLTMLSGESMDIRPGARAVLDRLCDVLFIQAIRGWVSTDPGQVGWPAAVRDRAIDEALDLMQRMPAEPWTVERLADRVALSRSVFAERFRRLSGDAPMEYLARWRMHLASQRLREGMESVAEIATKVGYESEAAFAKAFKRRVGVAPGAYRRGGALFFSGTEK